MGRITIFTRDGCYYCTRAKRELQYRCLPFVEIPLGSFPERLEDMMSLSGCLTVPQIFFNETFVGGSDELVNLLEKWDAIDNDEEDENLPDNNMDGVTEETATTLSSAPNSIADDILKNSRIWRIYQQEVASQPDPTDARLALPSPLVVSGDNNHNNMQYQHAQLDAEDVSEAGEEINFGCIPLPNGTCAGIREVTNDLVERMPRMKLAYLTKFYTDCFPGDNGVDALLQIYPFRHPGESDEIARSKAVEFGRLLQQYGILHHVCNEHLFHDTGSYYYRLQPFHQPSVLNSFQSLQKVLEHFPDDQSLPSVFMKRSDKSLPDSTPRLVTPEGAMKLLNKLQTLLDNIESRATTREGIDFLAAKNYDDPEFLLLEEGSCQLQCLDPLALATTMPDKEKTVFGIHLYNIMVRHANIKLGVPMKSSERGAFYNRVCYSVANQLLSLDDVEHGILRANTRHPYHLKAQFVGDDPRRAWAVSKLDPRIHFTLYCGANSCPPIHSYTVENLDDELQLVAEAFCQNDENVLLDEESKTISVNMIFKWYRNDFGCSSSKDLPIVILSYLPPKGEKYSRLLRMIQRKAGKDIKIKYLPYDWGSRAAPGKCLEFHSGALKTRETSLRAPFSKTAASCTGGGCIPAA